MSVTSVQRAIKLIAEQLNFGKKVSTHTLRHCYASQLLERGASLKAIQKLLGHSSLQTTMVYLHLTQTAEANTRTLIEQLFVRPPLGRQPWQPTFQAKAEVDADGCRCTAAACSGLPAKVR